VRLREVIDFIILKYEGVSKSFRTGCLERELQMVQLSVTRCSCIAILWGSLVSLSARTLCVASQRVLIVVDVYFVIDSVRKLLDSPSYRLMLNENSALHLHLHATVKLYSHAPYNTSWRGA
jgi:hypothetical protein